jgi:hypothetical protein
MWERRGTSIRPSVPHAEEVVVWSPYVRERWGRGLILSDVLVRSWKEDTMFTVRDEEAITTTFTTYVDAF